MTGRGWRALSLLLALLALPAVPGGASWKDRRDKRIRDIDETKARISAAEKNIATTEQVLARALQDPDAVKRTKKEALAQRVLRGHRNALRTEQNTLKRLQAQLDAINRLPVETPGSKSVPPVVVPKFSGEVSVKCDGITQPLQLGIPIGEGCQISTNKNSTVEINFEDGSRLILAGNSTFQVDTPTGKAKKMGFLKKGIIRLIKELGLEGASRSHHGEIATPTAVAAVRGTEFDLEVDDQGLTRLRPQSGGVTLRASEEKLDRAKLSRWWSAKTLPKTAAPAQRAPAWVSWLEGTVETQRAGETAWAAAAQGGKLLAGDRIRTGPDGFARVAMVDAGAALLRPGSELLVGSAGPEFTLRSGALHYARKAAGAVLGEPRFRLANVVAAVRGTEFELSIDSSTGLGEVMPFAGELDVDAEEAALPPGADRWWEKLYDEP